MPLMLQKGATAASSSFTSDCQVSDCVRQTLESGKLRN